MIMIWLKHVISMQNFQLWWDFIYSNFIKDKSVFTSPEKPCTKWKKWINSRDTNFTLVIGFDLVAIRGKPRNIRPITVDTFSGIYSDVFPLPLPVLFSLKIVSIAFLLSCPLPLPGLLLILLQALESLVCEVAKVWHFQWWLQYLYY